MRSIQRNKSNRYDLTLSKTNEEPKEKEADFLSELGKFRRLSAPLLIVTIVLVCFGLIMLFSASMSTSFATQDDDAKYYFIRQAGMVALGLGGGLFIANFLEIKSINNKWLVLGAYIFTTILLILVIIKGRSEMGATRWINIGPIGLQPSELAKFSSVLFLAYYFSFTKSKRARGKIRAKSPSRQFWLDGRIDFLYPVLILGFWLILIVIQPHLSGAIIFLALCFAVFLAARIPWKSWLSGIIQLLPILLIGIVLLSLILPATKDITLSEFIESKFAHSAKRIETFEAADEVSEDQSYQIRQAEIAMGTGGLIGVGLGQGRQKYNYLPQVHNDYIFPAIAEELGYLGTMSVLILFAIQFFIGVKFP